jgi:hypothetical protein
MKGHRLSNKRKYIHQIDNLHDLSRSDILVSMPKKNHMNSLAKFDIVKHINLLDCSTPYETDGLLSTPISNKIQPVMNANPPNGVIIPNQLIPVILRKYKLPENNIHPAINPIPLITSQQFLIWNIKRANINKAMP